MTSNKYGEKLKLGELEASVVIPEPSTSFKLIPSIRTQLFAVQADKLFGLEECADRSKELVLENGHRFQALSAEEASKGIEISSVKADGHAVAYLKF